MNTVRFFWGTGEIGAVFVALRMGHQNFVGFAALLLRVRVVNVVDDWVPSL